MRVFDNDALSEFLASVMTPDCVRHCAVKTGASDDAVLERIRIYAGEVPIALSLLQDLSLTGCKLLDVGAGIGLTSIFLHRSGYAVTALEPGDSGFEINPRLFNALCEYTGCTDLPFLSMGAEELEPSRDGYFDIMFSANVLEHVSDLKGAVEGMARALTVGGVMVHTCPNYTIPYEPHYRMLLFPIIPAATPWAGVRRDEGLWQSFNFITAAQLERCMRRAKLKPRFAKGVMANTFERLLTDTGFAQRHSPALARIAKILRVSGGLKILQRWPARLATPMVVMATKSELN